MDEDIKRGLLVKDLLKIPHFKEARLLGGEAGLNQTVSRVNVMEVPDVVNWVRPGEFLMTTGYPFRKKQEVMETLIADLANKGVVALGIKIKRFIEEVPEAAVQAANHYGLPLIELPPDTTFSDVVREVMVRVLVQEPRELSILQNRVQRLSNVLFHDEGLLVFLNHLQQQVQNPVVLLDPHNQWTASSGALPLCEQISDETWLKLRDDSGLEACFIPIEESNVRVYVSSILSGRSSYLLLMFEDRNEHNIVDTMTITWAAELLGFEIRNAQARKNIEAKYIDQFLQDWIIGRIVSVSDLQLRAEACGCPLDEKSSYLVGIVHFRDRKSSINELRELAKRLNWDFSTGNMALKWTVLEEDLVVLIIRPKSDIHADFRKEEANGALLALRHVLPERKVNMCLGKQVTKQDEVQSSYREAKRAKEVSSSCNLQEEVICYGELGIYQLLYRLLETQEAHDFIRTYLQPLIEYDLRHQTSLIKTIQTFLECNGNVKETAERMFLHYNTVTYRLERIKNEFGYSLDDAETRLLLNLAIKLNSIHER